MTTHLRLDRFRAADGEMATTIYGKDIRPGEATHWEHYIHRFYGPDSLHLARTFAVSVGLPVVRSWREAMEKARVYAMDGKYHAVEVARES